MIKSLTVEGFYLSGRASDLEVVGLYDGKNNWCRLFLIPEACEKKNKNSHKKSLREKDPLNAILSTQITK